MEWHSSTRREVPWLLESLSEQWKALVEPSRVALGKALLVSFAEVPLVSTTEVALLPQGCMRYEWQMADRRLGSSTAGSQVGHVLALLQAGCMSVEGQEVGLRLAAGTAEVEI